MNNFNHKDTIYPRPLKSGDRIAILSPAGIINPKLVTDSLPVLKAQGWDPVVMPHALGQSGSYSGTKQDRLSDLKEAFSDPSVRAILCSRGGYGVVHLMDELSQLPIEDDPKWVIGYSDISALHALMASKGIASIHASMAKIIAKGDSDPNNQYLFKFLRGERPPHTFKGDRYNRLGQVEGTLLGGNLAVIAELINTPYDVIQEDSILFIEDVSEPIYKIERIMYQLRLSGVLGKLRGLIVGQFTDYKADKNYDTMETMIRDMVSPYNYPVAFNVPIGHVDYNIPILCRSHITLKVNHSGDNSIIYWR